MFSARAIAVFNESIETYHRRDQVDQPLVNPYPKEDILHLLYRKNWIDTIQWHLEDLIRNPEIIPENALELKRRIDSSNQERTDLVEFIDGYFLDKYRSVLVLEGATINTESPAWAIDRLSILALKIYHMKEAARRTDASPEHLQNCGKKLLILEEQERDLAGAIDQLLTDIETGRKCMKVYKQMKMYNDEELNPVLRARK